MYMYTYIYIYTWGCGGARDCDGSGARDLCDDQLLEQRVGGGLGAGRELDGNIAHLLRREGELPQNNRNKRSRTLTPTAVTV